MILVTVGAQMPFDRLVQVVDTWALRRGRSDVFVQIGEADWHPKHVEWRRFLTPAEFRARMRDAQWLVSHAGMGSILTALEYTKPILVMPRRADLGETRNDHQFATAKKLEELGHVTVAWDEHELRERLDGLEDIPPSNSIRSHASNELLTGIRRFLDSTR